MARVLRPGGVLSWTDSIQIYDRSAFGAVLDAFKYFNEPHYPDYLRCDVEAGLVCEEKYLNSRSKTLSFTKPMK
jgi:hypothetical protein